MAGNTQIADAPSLHITGGDSRTIEVRTADGRALMTMVRMTLEMSQAVSEALDCEIRKEFARFCENVERLF